MRSVVIESSLVASTAVLLYWVHSQARVLLAHINLLWIFTNLHPRRCVILSLLFRRMTFLSSFSNWPLYFTLPIMHLFCSTLYSYGFVRCFCWRKEAQLLGSAIQSVLDSSHTSTMFLLTEMFSIISLYLILERQNRLLGYTFLNLRKNIWGGGHIGLIVDCRVLCEHLAYFKIQIIWLLQTPKSGYIQIRD